MKSFFEIDLDFFRIDFVAKNFKKPKFSKFMGYMYAD